MSNETKGKCHFCNSILSTEPTEHNSIVRFDCPGCGPVFLTEDAFDDISAGVKGLDLSILRIILRNQHEARRGRRPQKALTISDLHQLVKEYKPLSPIEKMDNALLLIEKKAFII